jgi:ribosomal protein S18 acetylase RimI-like enzyme
MQFELTEALLDDILFSMEDQECEFMLDTVEGVVCGGPEGLDFLNDEDEADDESAGSRYISLPEWASSDGFRLMERFAASFKNPLVRQELSSALNVRRGVFRAFKDTLSRYPEAEKLWFAYKDREMKREIIRWYNGLREEWGLEKIGMAPEETGDLVLEDFHFRPFQKEDMAQAEDLHRQCQDEYRKFLEETGAGSSAGVLAKEAQAFREFSPSVSSNLPSGGLVAESGDGEFSGFIFGIEKDSSFYIQNLEVKAEFRGLGIGEALLTRFLESLNPNKVREVFLDLPSWAEDFSRVLLRESFKPYTVRYWLKLGDRTD